MANFDEAIKVVLKHEGGYVNDPLDPGGETKYGISKRSYPHLDIKNLTEQQAKVVYYVDFWDKNNYESIVSDAVAQKVFDTAVNVGSSQANKMLQRACNLVANSKLVADGDIGPKTLAIVNSIKDEAELLSTYRALQENYYKSIVRRNPSQVKFLKGWMNRASS